MFLICLGPLQRVSWSLRSTAVIVHHWAPTVFCCQASPAVLGSGVGDLRWMSSAIVTTCVRLPWLAFPAACRSPPGTPSPAGGGLGALVHGPQRSPAVFGCQLLQLAHMACVLGRRTVRCARAVRKAGYLGPKGRGTVLPYNRTAQILTQSKDADNELNQTFFPTNNARSPSTSAAFAPGTQPPRWWGVFRVATGTLLYCWALCPRCAEPPP